MSTTRLAALAALLFLALAPVAAEAGRDLLVNIRTSVEPGSSQGPALLITPRKDVASLRIDLVRRGPGGTEQVRLSPIMRTGQENEVVLPHPPGRFSWEGSLGVTFADGAAGEMPLSFETSRVASLQITSNVSREDVMARRVVLQADRPVDRAVVEVTGDGGRRLGRSEIDLEGAEAGSDLVITWEQQEEGDPLVVFLRLFDTEGSWRGIRWMPWEVRIPHDTVEFDTGKATIREDQVPKLRAVLGELNRQLARYEGLVDAEVSLWIVGHTDTVGSREHNRRLSEARARSIARWFRRAGVPGAIHYRGLGQEAPLVATPDNIDEPRNRRAEYVVAGEDPYAGRDLPGRWHQLR